MDGSDLTPGGVLALTGFGLAGLVGTVVAGVAALAVLQPVQPVVYDALYRQLGPWTATSAATVVQFGAGGALAVGIPTLAAEYVDGRRPESVAAVLAAGVVGVVVLVVAGVVTAVPAMLVAIVATGLFVVAAVVALGRVNASRGSRTAFVGGVPALALLLVLLGVGLGWGGGYDVVAEPAPEGAQATADFADAPELREDLFAPGACEEDSVCRLPLRLYEHEAAAGRFLDDNGVRCPLVNDPSARDWGGSFVATHDDDPYRVTCVAYGD
jgi:hypothetical protein